MWHKFLTVFEIENSIPELRFMCNKAISRPVGTKLNKNNIEN